MLKSIIKVMNQLTGAGGTSTQRVDNRRLQHELDMHRLFLLTTHFARQGTEDSNSETYVQDLADEADRLQFEGMERAVARNLDAQISNIARILQDGLLSINPVAASTFHEQPTEVQPRRSGRVRGLGATMGPRIHPARQADFDAGGDDAGPSGRAPVDAAQTAHIVAVARSGMQQLSVHLLERLGYTLHVAASAVGHPGAGDGLWLQGHAPPGAVVGLYPGIVYTPLYYRHMPGYPRIDLNNDTLMSRFDRIVLDALPWHRGAWAALPAPATPRHADATARLHALQTQNPLALAHIANHPPAGRTPNVMIAAYDFRARAGEAWRRGWQPTVVYGEEPRPEALLEPDVPVGALTTGARPTAEPVVPGLALVATREVKDEELLLNYRLSPGMSRPAWYTPVDAEEEHRRWA